MLERNSNLSYQLRKRAWKVKVRDTPHHSFAPSLLGRNVFSNKKATKKEGTY
jgi:hypothetical protein